MLKQCKVGSRYIIFIFWFAVFDFFCRLLLFVNFLHTASTKQKTTNSAGTSTSNSNPTSLLKSKATSVGMILKPKRKSEYLFVVSMFYFS